MKKAQLSVDLLLAIVMFLVFLQAVVLFQKNFELNQEKTTIRLQAKQIISELEKTLKYAYSLEKNSDYTIILEIPRIYITSPASSQQSSSAFIGCTIDANPDTRIISLTVDSTQYEKLGQTETISEEMAYQLGVHGFETSCGQEITLSKQ